VPGKIDKLIVTHFGALQGKYGRQGLQKIRKALADLATADKARGLETVSVGVDDSSAMRKYSLTPVKDASDPAKNKAAIDGLYQKVAPDYILLLGATDVIPHQDLKNPLYSGSTGDDPDEFAYGDLPYACDAPYSQNPQDFFGPVRVVGRLPDITGGSDPAYLLGLIATATNYKAVDRNSLTSYFAVTAQIWKSSTELSVTNTFGNASLLQDVPPSSSNWPQADLQKPMHFFNCHGASNTPQFFGQPSSGRRDYPVALDASYITGKIQPGTIAAAECCYGAQLYALSSVQPQMGVCNVYLGSQGYGFFGSTTIAYGPASGNAQADLICQYFLQSILAGASLGRAALQARQKFMRSASPADPSDIKTLAQFNLYGDPSLTAVAADPTVKALEVKTPRAEFEAERVERHDRRRQLLNQGHSLNREPKARRARTPSPKARRALVSKAESLGFAPGDSLAFTLRYEEPAKRGPRLLRQKSQLPRGYHVLFLQRKSREDRAESASGVRPIEMLIGKEVAGRIVSISHVLSR